jgi:hypothetical protein
VKRSYSERIQQERLYSDAISPLKVSYGLSWLQVTGKLVLYNLFMVKIVRVYKSGKFIRKGFRYEGEVS